MAGGLVEDLSGRKLEAAHPRDVAHDDQVRSVGCPVGLLDVLAILAMFGIGVGLALRAPLHRLQMATADHHG